MFESLGSRTYRYRYLVVAAWIVAAVVAFAFAPSLASQGTADQASFLPTSAPSSIAEKALARAFPGSAATSSATITFSRDAGLTDADRAYLDAFGAWTRSAAAPLTVHDAVTSLDSARTRPELASMLRSGDGRLELLNVNLNVSSAGDKAAEVVGELRAHAASTAPTGLAVHVTGTAGITTDYLQAIKSGTDSTTRVTVILVLLILLLIYRAPLAALVPLVTIGGAFVVARGVLGFLAAAGWQISSLLDTFVVVLVFGVGTDYTIFLISRYREEVSQGDWHDASRRTVRRIGAVISASAATVIVGLGAMAFGSFEMIRSTGPALAVAIFVTLIAGLTLAPALLGIFGHYLFWPQHNRTGAAAEPEGFFARLAAIVTRHPGAVTIALVVALLIPAAFVPQMKTNFDTLAELPAASDARLGYDEVAAHLGKGKLAQSTGLIDTGPQGDVLSPSSLALLRDTAATISGTSGVDSVVSLVTPNGDGVVPDGFKPSLQLTTIADSFSSGSSSGSGSPATTSSILDPQLSGGLSDALDYVNALGLAFPDAAARSEFRAATKAIADAQAIVDRVKARSIVSTQLRTLAAALTSPTAVASGGSVGGSADTALVANYLDELRTAYPSVRAVPAFAAATAAAASLERTATVTAAVSAATALNQLAVHFDATPNATLAATSLANTPAALEARREATAAFSALPGALRGLASVFSGRADDIFIPVGLGDSTKAAPLGRAVDAFVSKDRTATRFYVTATNDPYATTSFSMVRAVQVALTDAAPRFGAGATASLGGPTAQFSDVQTVLASDFQRVGIITVLGILIVLMLLLRAIVAPLYLVATVLLSYASAVGLSAWLFQEPLGAPGVSFYLPLLVFVLLVALGSDYNIFLMSRVREESETRPIGEGIRVASGRTGAVITSAGLILAGTFGSMATAQLAVLFQIGVAVAIGVLIDTFVVRSILVPAITARVGDRAWWPSGISLGGRGQLPAPLVPDSRRLASTEDRPPRSTRRVATAIVLAMLVPATFAGLLLWASPQAGSAPIHAAIVNGDEGATTMAGDGSTEAMSLGADLVETLAKGRATGQVSWTAADAPAAGRGLSDGTYTAVLTIPAGYSRAVAAIRADQAGNQPAPTLHLQTSDDSGAAAQQVARDLAAAVAVAATSDATASYLGDLLLAVSTTKQQLRGVTTTAGDIASRTTAMAADASGVGIVAGELVAGLELLSSGTTSAVDGATKLASAVRALATGASRLSGGAGSLANGATDAATGAVGLATGAASLADGLAALDARTSSLPAQAAALDAGATSLAAGANAAASGAASLSSGLTALTAQTSGLGTQTAALDSAAATVDSGAAGLAAGAHDAASGAADLATNASQLATAVDDYASSVDTLAASCLAMGGGATVCSALAQISATSATLAAGASAVATGADQVAGATGAIASGAHDLASGATSLHAGTSALAAATPQLEWGIAQSAAGAESLVAGSAGVAAGAVGLAEGTGRLAAGMPSLAAGVTALSSAGSTLAVGASSLSTGVSGLASGATRVAAGARETAAGASSLADGLAASASGANALSSAIGQVVDGAKVVQAETGQLAQTGGALAADAARAANANDLVPSYPTGTERRGVGPVSIETTTTSGASPTGIAPDVMALALWLGALAALVVLPAGRRPIGRRPWMAPVVALLAASVVSVGAVLAAVLGLVLVGLSIARLPELLVVAVVAAVTFVAIIQALVVAFGRRGWLIGVLLAGLQVAASGLILPFGALPGPLAFVHPLLPLSPASDALRAAIGGGNAGSLEALVALTTWFAGAVVVTLVVATRPSGHAPTAGRRAGARFRAQGSAAA